VKRSNVGERCQPKQVVTAAYQAANAGRYAEASSYLAPSVALMIQRTRQQAGSSSAELRRLLIRLQRRRDPRAAGLRKLVKTLARVNTAVRRMLGPSGRQHRTFWDMATRKRQLVDVRATRQVIRGRKGRVYLQLTLADGTTARDSEPVVSVKGRWHLG
jgi:hypothetical protein